MTGQVEALPPAGMSVPLHEGRPMTICGIGYASSNHVAMRLKCFAERGHRVYVITETHAGKEIEGVTQLVPALDPKLRDAPWFKALWWACRNVLRLDFDHFWRFIVFLQLLRRVRPDVVHVHFAYSYYAWLAGIAGCHPLVVTVMGGDILFEEQGSPTRTGKILTLNLLEVADLITSKSHHLTSVLERLGGFAAKAERVTWGIPLNRFRRVDTSAMRSELRIPTAAMVVLSPRILQRLYRIHLIVEAMPAVLAACGEVFLVIAELGAAPDYRAEIETRIGDLGIADNVRFVGALPHARMPEYYSLADVSVGVPTSDGLPQSLLEGMACGVVNLLSRLARYEEIVKHKESAYFVDGTAQSIADGIIELLKDSNLRRRIEVNARAIVVREGNLDEEARRVEARYYDLMQGGPRRILDWRNIWRVPRNIRRFGASQAAGPTAPVSADPRTAPRKLLEYACDPGADMAVRGQHTKAGCWQRGKKENREP